MTDKFKGWYPDYIENEKEREPILKLAKMMTGRAKKKLGLEKMTKYDPEYWGLALPGTKIGSTYCFSCCGFSQLYSTSATSDISSNCFSR